MRAEAKSLIEQILNNNKQRFKKIGLSDYRRKTNQKKIDNAKELKIKIINQEECLKC